jgi:hypothetical protein
MATGPQPNESIPFGAEMFGSIQRASAQIKALRSELRKVDRDLAKVGRDTKGIDKTLIQKRREITDEIKKYERVIDYQKRVQAGQKQINNEMKETARNINLFKGIAHLEIARKIARGEAGIEDVIQLGLLNREALEKGTKALSKLGRVGTVFGTAAGAVSRFLPHVAIAQAIAPLVSELVVDRIAGSAPDMEAIQRALLKNTAANAAQLGAVSLAAIQSGAFTEALAAENAAGRKPLYDDPEWVKKVDQLTLRRIKEIVSGRQFLESLTADDINEIVGQVIAGGKGETIASRREAINKALMDFDTRKRVEDERTLRQEKARMDRERRERMSETDRFWEHEQKTFEEIAYRLRRSVSELPRKVRYSY